MVRLALVAALVVSAVGCGGDIPAVPPAQSDLRGTWSAPIGPRGCVFAVTFSAEEAYGAGLICRAPASGEVDVEWDTGTFTLAPDGRINFYPQSGEGCHVLVLNAEYGGPASRPTITLPPPRELVMIPSESVAVPADAVPGCFDSAWTFTPSP